MSASLVGSEMCIRDSSPPLPTGWCWRWLPARRNLFPPALVPVGPLGLACLLYTSDAADDM
eukprot:3925452-Alexandrium_andersonii.AAC.1